MTSFSDATLVSGYAERTARIVPGLADLHRMAGVLLGERAPRDARILVLGAGGGLELQALAAMQPNWRFDGVDPSAEMLQLARIATTTVASRVHLHEGYVHTAPPGPFDGATCLLTLHFLPADECLETLKQLFQRLKPGAALVVAHHSIPDAGGNRQRWLERYVAFTIANGAAANSAQDSIAAISQRLPVLSPEQDVALLHEAGFQDVEPFYAAFTFRGWVAYRND